MELNSGSWTAKICNILVVEQSQNMVGRDILKKLGLTLTQQQPEKCKEISNINEKNIKQNITNWIFKKYPHLCTRLGRRKNHYSEVKIYSKKRKNTNTTHRKKSTTSLSQKSREGITKTNPRQPNHPIGEKSR